MSGSTWRCRSAVTTSFFEAPEREGGAVEALGCRGRKADVERGGGGLLRHGYQDIIAISRGAAARRTLPLAVFGSSSAKSTMRGYL